MSEPALLDTAPVAAPSLAPLNPAPDLRRTERFLLLAFFVSGATGLVFEVVWTRLLAVVFGATSLAAASVLAAYMAGLGLGGFLGGRLALRVTRPLRTYALLEAAVALYGLAVPFLTSSLTPLYRGLYSAWAPSFLAFSLMRFGLIFVVLLIPTTLMGATLPLLSRLAEGPRGDGLVSKLYAVNTAGAVAGTLLAGFGLVAHLGVRLSNFTAAAMGLSLAGLVLLLGRSVVAPPVVPLAPKEDLDVDDELAAAPATLVALAFALSGAASMIDEVAWTRALVLLIGPSTYAFTVMLAAFLLGIALGSALAARGAAKTLRPLLWLALVEGLAAAATSLAIIGFEPAGHLYRAFTGAGPGGRGPLAIGVKSAIAMMLLVPTATMFGASFPLAAAAYVRGRNAVARRVGELYTANTVGCIAGSLLAGFGLVPRIGIQGALIAAGTLNACVGLLLLLRNDELRPAVRLTGVVALGMLAIALPLRTPRWDATELLANVPTSDSPGAPAQLLFEQPGYTATVAVTLHREHVSHLALRTDGKTDASDVGDLPTQIQLGLVPLLFHPDPARVLVVGLASGTTCGSVLRDARVKRLDVLEIERGMIAASHFFDHMNGKPLADPRTRLIENDARNHYRASADHYDVIVSEPSNPWMSGPAHLFTREAFQEAHDLLNPGGVMMQWMQGYALQPETAGGILNSFQAVFRSVRIFAISDNNDYLIVGSDAALPLDLKTLASRMAPMAAEALRGGLRDPWDLVAENVADHGALEPLVKGLEASTDDNNMVEFKAPLAPEDTAELGSWVASRFDGPYGELASQGISPAEIGWRLGERMALDAAPEMAPHLSAFLAAHGELALAEQLAALLRLQPPAAPAQSDAAIRLEQIRAWLVGASSATPRGPTDERFGSLLGGAAPLPGDLEDPLLGSLAARNLARAGQCAPVLAAKQEALGLLDPHVDSWMQAHLAAQANDWAEALGRCGEPMLGRQLAHASTASHQQLANLVLDANPNDPDAALAIDATSTRALWTRAQQACAGHDAANEERFLLRLFELEPWRGAVGARLIHLAADRPATDPTRMRVERERPYLAGALDHDQPSCL